MHIRLTGLILLLCALSGAIAQAQNAGGVGTNGAGAVPAPAASSPLGAADRAFAVWGALADKAPEPSAASNTAALAVGQSSHSHDPAPPHLALLPATPDSATLFERHAPVTLGGRALEEAAQTWVHTGDAPVVVGTNGAVMYAYGQSRPTVLCAPLRICVIHLVAGEHITNLSIGDSVRWLIQAAEAGAGNEVIPLVILKPTEANLVTNLAITTDAGRIYYLTLHSDERKYIPEIGFYDPQQIVIRLAQQRAAADSQAAAHQGSVVDNLGAVDPGSLDFDFACKAKDRAAERWLPLRVFAGGGHTYVQMPATLADGDAPALFNLVEIGHHTQTELINSRLLHGYYVIDGLPARFQLLVGAGRAARTVTCSHG